MKLLLKQLGVKNPVRWIDDGATAMSYLQSAEVKPKILLLDVKLPRMTGFEILDKLRDMPAYKDTLRIVFSSLDDIDTIKEAYAHGAQTFLTKPLEACEFEAVIKGFRKHWILEEDTLANENSTDAVL